jgi:hypothetical protein
LLNYLQDPINVAETGSRRPGPALRYPHQPGLLPQRNLINPLPSRHLSLTCGSRPRPSTPAPHSSERAREQESQRGRSQPVGSGQISRYGHAFPFPSRTRRTPTQPPRSVPASAASSSRGRSGAGVHGHRVSHLLPPSPPAPRLDRASTSKSPPLSGLVRRSAQGLFFLSRAGPAGCSRGARPAGRRAPPRGAPRSRSASGAR